MESKHAPGSVVEDEERWLSEWQLSGRLLSRAVQQDQQLSAEDGEQQDAVERLAGTGRGGGSSGELRAPMEVRRARAKGDARVQVRMLG